MVARHIIIHRSTRLSAHPPALQYNHPSTQAYKRILQLYEINLN